ncbi:MAG: lysine--tRNA ligase [Deltaproteobacteria bacterium]|nr:MAG: lysine--tRNA ligase [Deltaproteobacteria bacterium]
MDTRYDNPLIKQRLEKAEGMREEGLNPYPNDFKPAHTSAKIRKDMEGLTSEEVEAKGKRYSVAGRIISMRVMGKNTFLKLRDRSGDMQLFVQRDVIGRELYGKFKKYDIGDFLGAKGTAFITKTGELSIKAKSIYMLTKSLRPLPEKFHGLTDKETRYRQRYVDLAINPDVQSTFITRTKVVAFIRKYFQSKDFLEVETPMLQTIPGGATAKPFETFHNALSVKMYMRIAPELYLKRLLVGGMERVFEINRNFRNEGLSNQHNPEFTMLEFYQAYATYEDMMAHTEALFSKMAKELTGGYVITYQEQEIDFAPKFNRLTMQEAVERYSKGELSVADTEDEKKLLAFAGKLGIADAAKMSWGKLLAEVFETVAEPHLIQPTFITQYPVDVSPLSRRNEKDPRFTDRFEFYIAGREIANGFSELNDPVDQLERFKAQSVERDKGDEEAHWIDEDYVRALEYGMPPAGGEGIGIDRTVMIFTDAPSIRDVIFFPHMRPERTEG